MIIRSLYINIYKLQYLFFTIQAFPEGSKVWKINSRKATRKGDKLDQRRNGPYVVHSYIGKGVYRLMKEGDKQPMKQKVNGCYLAPVNERKCSEHNFVNYL